jgi:threonine/homoserine/homoserine lactone efflux protein
MQKLKNILVGFLVSFVGSIPLGYLNIIGYEIYSKKGFQNTVEYLIGVVLVEAVVIYATLLFADVLTQQKKWLKRIELFTIIFLLILGASFFLNQDNTNATSNSVYTNYLPFFTGLILSALNFIQIPFWTGWNLYLINNKYISIEKSNKYLYLFGTLFGTFFGMLGLIFGLHYFAKNSGFVDAGMISKIFPIIFFGLALLQIIKFYKKYYSK